MKKKIFGKQSEFSPEFEYFLKADLSRYKGQYVALLGKKVVASGVNAKQVWQKARKKFPAQLPTLAKLPKEEVFSLRFLSFGYAQDKYLIFNI